MRIERLRVSITFSARMRQLAATIAALGLVLLARPAHAQQRPLVTEDPESIGAGRILIESGIDWSHDAVFPLSGLKGNLTRLPTIGFSFGVSSIAELQIDGGPYNSLAITERGTGPLQGMLTVTGDSTHDVEDFVVGMKVRMLSETGGRPALGIRFATRLPNAGNESGLGLDTTDFYTTILLAKTIQSIRVVGNVGFGILGDPMRGDSQNDVMLLGVSFARAMTTQAEIVGEFNGRLNTRNGEPPVGTESRGTMRIGGRYTKGALRLDGALMLGMTPRDPNFGMTAGFTYVFNAFKVP